jgi:hypothetical protein
LRGTEVLGYVTAEVRWIVRVYCYAQPQIHHPLEIVVLDGIEDAQLDVGERADGQRYLFCY